MLKKTLLHTASRERSLLIGCFVGQHAVVPSSRDLINTKAVDKPRSPFAESYGTEFHRWRRSVDECASRARHGRCRYVGYPSNIPLHSLSVYPKSS